MDASKKLSLFDKTDGNFLTSEQNNSEKDNDGERTQNRAEDGLSLAAADVRSASAPPRAVAEARRLQHRKWSSLAAAVIACHTPSPRGQPVADVFADGVAPLGT